MQPQLQLQLSTSTIGRGYKSLPYAERVAVKNGLLSIGGSWLIGVACSSPLLALVCATMASGYTAYQFCKDKRKQNNTVQEYLTESRVSPERIYGPGGWEGRVGGNLHNAVVLKDIIPNNIIDGVINIGDTVSRNIHSMFNATGNAAANVTPQQLQLR